MFRGFKECIFLEKVNTALQNLENHKVLLKDPVRPNEGPWLGMDPVGGSSCVPWYDFLYLECKNMANIVDFHLWAIFKNSETPAWLGLKRQRTWYSISQKSISSQPSWRRIKSQKPMKIVKEAKLLGT